MSSGTATNNEMSKCLILTEELTVFNVKGCDLVDRVLNCSSWKNQSMAVLLCQMELQSLNIDIHAWHALNESHPNSLPQTFEDLFISMQLIESSKVIS